MGSRSFSLVIGWSRCVSLSQTNQISFNQICEGKALELLGHWISTRVHQATSIFKEINEIQIDISIFSRAWLTRPWRRAIFNHAKWWLKKSKQYNPLALVATVRFQSPVKWDKITFSDLWQRLLGTTGWILISSVAVVVIFSGRCSQFELWTLA